MMAAIAGALIGTAASAEDLVTYRLVLKDHRFQPAELHLPAGRASILVIQNLDSDADEFESSALKVEKPVAGGQTITVRLRALSPGRYPFVGEFHKDTATGVVIVE
jgi:hypothetical protein